MRHRAYELGLDECVCVSIGVYCFVSKCIRWLCTCLFEVREEKNATELSINWKTRFEWKKQKFWTKNFGLLLLYRCCSLQSRFSNVFAVCVKLTQTITTFDVVKWHHRMLNVDAPNSFKYTQYTRNIAMVRSVNSGIRYKWIQNSVKRETV